MVEYRFWCDADFWRDGVARWLLLNFCFWKFDHDDAEGLRLRPKNLGDLFTFGGASGLSGAAGYF